MKVHPDTFGLYLWDAYKGRNVPHIIERDDGHINANPNSTKMYFSNYGDWPEAEQQAISHAHGSVLDIGCGAGRHSLYLQEQDHHVLAVDASPLAVKVSQERGVKHTLVAYANDLSLDERFDAMLLLGNGFGLFGTPENAKKQLTRLHKLITDEATIIMDTVDPHVSTNPSHTEYQEQNRRENRLIGQIRLRHRYEIYASPWFDFFMVSVDETRMILEGTGWRIKELIDQDKAWYWAVIEKT